MLKKLQSQVISIVLISGIALALAGTAYYWGLPLLEKTQKNVELESGRQFMEDLAKAIEEVALTGNTKVIDYDLKGELIINGSDPKGYFDSIEYKVEAPLPYYATLSYVPINDYPPYKKEIYVVSTSDSTGVEIPICKSATTSTCIIQADCTNNQIDFLTGCSITGSKTEGDTISCGEDTYTVHTYTCDSYGLAYLEGSKIYPYAGIEGVNKPIVLMVRNF